ncbi:MAG TPA: ABC transporter ATP-binding protein [Gemmatimonadaceae bacterium]|nr:ABC transporter ATP-binding protein [Gemmatimonadaceae bacterium]
MTADSTTPARPHGPMYRRLLTFLRPHWWRMAGNIASNVVGAALDGFVFTLLIPFLNALFKQPSTLSSNKWLGAVQDWVVGKFVNPGDPLGSAEHMMGVIIAIVVLKNAFLWMAGQLGASMQEYVTRDLRDTVFTHMQRLPLGYFQRVKTGQIMSTVLSDTEQTKVVITELVTKTIQNLAQVVVTIVILLSMSPLLTGVSLIIAPLLTLALQPILRTLRRGYRGLRRDYGEISSVVQEVVSGIRLVKSFGGESYEDRRFGDASGGYSRGMVRITRVSLLSQPLTEIIGTSIAVLVLWVGAKQVFATPPRIDAATLVTFMILVMRLLPPLKQLSQAPTAAQQSFAAAERLFDVIDRPTEVQMDTGTRKLPGLERAIEFDDVSFAYDTEPVLSGISFTARRGGVVALVGASGAGKTTLVDLIPRFYTPTSGRILFDGVDSRDVALDSLRALTGIVSQDTVLFNDTVRNNIAYGAAHRFTQEQIERAARAANAHEFIAALPDGYDTILGERGTRLSGGQRQRIAIARALLVDPPILILDEATSALDTESERLVQEAVDRLLAGRTVFVIAHRLSTIVHADLILVLDRGRIVERGTHAELLAERGAYFRLHSLQFRDEDRVPANV